MTARVLRIRTPEGVLFSQTLAGPVIRFLAWFIDLLVIMMLLNIAGLAVRLLKLLSEDVAAAFFIIAYFVLSIGYGLFCEWRLRGQTVGKKIFKLRVVDAEGLRLRFDQIVVRNLLRFVDSLPFLYALGGAACWFSPRYQRLGDFAANTVVIRIPVIAEPEVDQLSAGRFNSLRGHPHLEARLRQRIGEEDAAIALQALLRREDFDPDARVELFAEIAAHFRSLVKFPGEATDGVSDEQYIRNVVDVLYRQKPKTTAGGIPRG